MKKNLVLVVYMIFPWLISCGSTLNNRLNEESTKIEAKEFSFECSPKRLEDGVKNQKPEAYFEGLAEIKGLVRKSESSNIEGSNGKYSRRVVTDANIDIGFLKFYSSGGHKKFKENLSFKGNPLTNLDLKGTPSLLEVRYETPEHKDLFATLLLHRESDGGAGSQATKVVKAMLFVQKSLDLINSRKLSTVHLSDELKGTYWTLCYKVE